MKFTLSWLKTHLDTPASLQEITERLTAIGLEVEKITGRAAALTPFLAAEILDAAPHPAADKLRVCKVNNGAEILQIVCGAPNARAGIKVVLAPVGTTMPGGMAIKAAKIRGVESNGMLCSARELGLGEDSAGIIELSASAVTGKPVAAQMGWDDPAIEIAVTPNRGDALSVYGVARDLATSGLGKLKKLDVSNEDFQQAPEQGDFPSPVGVTVEDPAKCPFYIGRYFRNVRNGESPDWLKARLISADIKPVSALVDITNFLMLDVGRPAHVYDAKKLSGSLTVRAARPGEKLTALDGREYGLDGELIISDARGPVAAAGIIGGMASGCAPETTDVFLEIALFDPIAIAVSGRALQIDSGARQRFERGVSSATLKHFLTASRMIQEICGGEMSKPVIAGSLPMTRREISFRPSRVLSLTGADVPEAEMRRIFENLGCVVEDGKTWTVRPPSWRPDLTIEEDLVEEIIRLHGYDKIPVTPLPGVAPIALTQEQCRATEIRHMLAARGMDEAVTFSFGDARELALFETEHSGSLTLANPISADLSRLRSSILPNLLAAVRRNAARGFYDLALFEIGPVFTGGAPGEQRLVAGGVRAGLSVPRNTHTHARQADLFDAKADALSVLSSALPASAVQVSRAAPAYYHPGRSGALLLGGKALGFFGELHPRVLKEMGIESTIAAFEIFLDAIPAAKRKSVARPKLELANFQAVERDFAFIVDSAMPAEDLLAAVRKSDKTLIKSAYVFDVYSGKTVPEGKKSVALCVRLQPRNRTLTDAEIEQISSKIVNSVKAVGGILRE